jgi:hypothetical protein
MKRLLTGIAVCLFAGCGFFSSVVLHDPGAFAKSWAVDSWTKNVKLVVDDKPGDIFYFDFPKTDGIHSVGKKLNKKSRLGDLVSVKYKITGTNPDFWSTEDEPAQVGFKFASASYFSNSANRQTLAVGTHTLTVKMTPENSVTITGFPCNYDAAHIEEFRKAVEGNTDIWICFGGTNHGYAHGAYDRGGPSRFSATSVSP